jgi:regulator of sigma E protease
VIFWFLTFKYGEAYTPNDKLVNGISPGIVGKEIGLQNGDRITEVNGKKIVRFEEIASSKVLLGNSEFTVVRDGQTQKITLPPNVLEKVSDHGLAEFIAPRFLASVGEVVAASNADKAGLQVGDKIVGVNGKPVRFLDEVRTELQSKKNTVVDLSVARGNKTLVLKTSVDEAGQIGFKPDGKEIPVEEQKYGFAESLPVGAAKAWGTLSDNVKGLGKVFKGEIKANKAFAGPVGIAHMFGAQVNWFKFWSLVGILSMALALMNLLPIPALDGGHAMFLLIEMVKGKPLSDKFLERAQIVGFVLLITLMVFIYGNDIITHVIKK